MKVIKLNEIRKLVKVKVIRVKDGLYSFDTDINRSLTFSGNVAELSKFLMRIKAKDSASSPRSNRKITYMKMANDIDIGKDIVIYLWLHNLNKLNKNNY